MARELIILVTALVVMEWMQVRTLVAGEPQVPCYYTFGDALVDSGNNNGLPTARKANYPPYGIDFPQGATGRYTNGRTITDIIGQLLRFPNFIPPYATATDQEISTGVNYGSGYSGILEETGSKVGDRVTFDRQILNHASVISRISALQQNESFTREYLKKCIYITNIGSDDYTNNYLKPNDYPTRRMYTPDQFAAVLVQKYSNQLTTLYNMGARKVGVFGLGPIGCTPSAIATFGTGGNLCVDSINEAVKLFNDRLKPLVEKLNHDLSDARFTFINFTSVSVPRGGAPLRIINPCCQIRADGQCIPNSIPCPVRALAFFYDGYHPSEIANMEIATRSYTKLSLLDASPYDISELVRL